MSVSCSTSLTTCLKPIPFFDTSLVTMSFLDYSDLTNFFGTCKGAQHFKEKVGARLEAINYSRLNIFDSDCYKKFWGVEITDQFDPDKIDVQVRQTFLKIYYGRNPIGRGRVKDACLIPTVVPKTVTVEGRVFDFTLDLLNDIADHPGIGHASKFIYLDNALIVRQRIGQCGVEEARLVIQLKDVFARNETWASQVRSLQVLKDNGYRCETEPKAIWQLTALVAHHAVTGQCPFRMTPMGCRLTFGRTQERVGAASFRVASGNFRPGYVDDLGIPRQADLDVFEDEDNISVHFGVGVQTVLSSDL